MNATSRVGATIRRNPFCRTVHVRALHQARRDPPAVLVPSAGNACACDIVLRNGDSARSPQWNRFQLERLAGMDVEASSWSNAVGAFDQELSRSCVQSFSR
jgi:hypothetical protein